MQSEPVFSHGQLYVAFSRATSSTGVFTKILDGDKQGHLVKKSNKVFTTNIVFKEIYK